MDIITPIDGSVVGSIAAASKEDVEKAIQAAKKSHKSGCWGRQSGLARAKVMRQIAKIVCPPPLPCSINPEKYFKSQRNCFGKNLSMTSC